MTFVLAGVAAIILLAVVWLYSNQRALVRLLASKPNQADLAKSFAGESHDHRLLATEVDETAKSLHVHRQAVTELFDRVSLRLNNLERTRARVEMDPADLQEMRAHWAELVCPNCGYAHTGACPRVKAQRVDAQTDQNGRVLSTSTVTDYWPNDQWQPPEGAVSAADVWGVPAPLPQVEANGAVS